MFRLTIVSFALNVVSIFLSVFNNAHEKTADIEKIAYQKCKALIDTRNNAQDSLMEDFGRFPRIF